MRLLQNIAHARAGPAELAHTSKTLPLNILRPTVQRGVEHAHTTSGVLPVPNARFRGVALRVPFRDVLHPIADAKLDAAGVLPKISCRAARSAGRMKENRL